MAQDRRFGAFWSPWHWPAAAIVSRSMLTSTSRTTASMIRVGLRSATCARRYRALGRALQYCASDLFSFELRGFSRSIPHSDTAPPSGCYLVCLVPCKDSIPHSKTSHTSSLPSWRPPQSTTLHMHASRVPVQKAQTERGHSPHCSLRGCEEPPPLLTLPGRAPGQMRADEAPHARFAIESPHGLL